MGLSLTDATSAILAQKKGIPQTSATTPPQRFAALTVTMELKSRNQI